MIVRAWTGFVMEAPEVSQVLVGTAVDCTLCFFFLFFLFFFFLFIHSNTSTYTAYRHSPAIISVFDTQFILSLLRSYEHGSPSPLVRFLSFSSFWTLLNSNIASHIKITNFFSYRKVLQYMCSHSLRKRFNLQMYREVYCLSTSFNQLFKLSTSQYT